MTGEKGSRPLDWQDFDERYTPARWREVLRTGLAAEAWAETFRQATHSGRPFGDRPFLEQLEAQLGQPVLARKPGPKGKPALADAPTGELMREHAP